MHYVSEVALQSRSGSYPVASAVVAFAVLLGEGTSDVLRVCSLLLTPPHRVTAVRPGSTVASVLSRGVGCDWHEPGWPLPTLKKGPALHGGFALLRKHACHWWVAEPYQQMTWHAHDMHALPLACWKTDAASSGQADVGVGVLTCSCWCPQKR